MTTIWYLLIGIMASILFIGGLMAAFQAGKESGIAMYGHKEENNETPNNYE